jgi:phospholipase/carboxylesterase
MKKKMMMISSKFLKSYNFTDTKRIVIAFHGYGASGADFLEIGEVSLAHRLNDTIFLFPDGTQECNAGFGRQWMDLEEMSYAYLRRGLDEVAQTISEYIQDAVAKYDCANVNLIGFSQGAIVALDALYHNSNIAKIIAYAGIFVTLGEEGKIPLSQDAQVLLVHSDDDTVIPYRNAVLAQENLTAVGIKNELKVFHGIGHYISTEGLEYGASFLLDSSSPHNSSITG